ncbi:MAG TPA: HPr family phosphocarrier protein [Xanthobacteraceae bacterium]|nr:HPr family phosphocarrier protein [Xanthobacteraceae bacterium]
MTDPAPVDGSCKQSGGAPPGTVVRELQIVNKKGLHARASARFVQTVERFQAEVKVSRCGETVAGNSIMGLMMLSAAPGTTIRVEARGADAAAALEALAKLVASRFGEED